MLEEDVSDGSIPGRTDARPPHPPSELPPLTDVRRTYIGWRGCPQITKGSVPSCIGATHSTIAPTIIAPPTRDTVWRTLGADREMESCGLQEMDAD